MIRSGEEILADIDTTLDQLFHNAVAINRISFDALFSSEKEALQKMQESLLARLIHMNDLLDQDEKRGCFRKQPKVYTSIEKKITQFGHLYAEWMERIKKDLRAAKKPNKHRLRIGKRRRRIKVPC